MNKRLLLSLYDRSGLGAYMPVDLKGHELEVEEHMEKFAELIVRECVKIIEDEAFNNYNKDKQRHPNSFEAGHDSGMFWSVGMIKQHFGVEE